MMIADRFRQAQPWYGSCACAPWEHVVAGLSHVREWSDSTVLPAPPPRTVVMARAALGFSLLAVMALGAAAFVGVLLGVALRAALAVGGLAS